MERRTSPDPDRQFAIQLADYLAHLGSESVLQYTPGDGPAFDLMLELLPEYNIEFAREAYVAFAENEDPIRRSQIVGWLPNLCKVDREFGVKLWTNLIRDVSDEVRWTSWTALEQDIAEHEDDLDVSTLSNYTGLTWQDATRLCRAHFAAEQSPHTRYQPGIGTPD